MNDTVNHPEHYTSHPSGVECITITEHMGFNLGNAIKYLWRADGKGHALEDLHKARWYVSREIARREAQLNRTAIAARIAGADHGFVETAHHSRRWLDGARGSAEEDGHASAGD